MVHAGGMPLPPAPKLSLTYSDRKQLHGVLLTDSCYGTTFSPSARALYGAGVPTQGVRGVSIESALAEFPLVGYAGRCVPNSLY